MAGWLAEANAMGAPTHLRINGTVPDRGKINKKQTEWKRKQRGVQFLDTIAGTDAEPPL